ncbi:phage tail tube protein [Chitinimonas sp.]|uniref:phage tail tube protein n=1 Tax=Chitinimonas sp. TaxID=1934313 RepID=UPI0035B36AB9
MPGSTRVKAFLLKVETVYGTDSTPAAATDAVLLRNTKITPMDAKMVSRDIETAAMGHMEDIAVGTQMMVEGEIEWAGSGTAGTAPKYGPLLRTCGLAEVLTASVSAAYNPISAGFESATGYYFYAGKKHVMTGVRGSVSGSMTAEGIPVLKYKLQGIYVGITDAALPAGIALTGYQKPVAVNKANTPPVSLFGQTFGFYDFSFDMSSSLVHRNLPGMEDQIITDRAPTGSITIPDPAIATVDFFSNVRSATLGTLTLTHGMTAGNIVGFSSSFVQVTKAEYDDKDKAVALKLDLKFVHSATGNDDFQLLAK